MPRRNHDAEPPPSADPVLRELWRRRLKTLEDCRKLWEAVQDPLALMVAVTYADMPPWLRDGLLAALDPRLTRIFKQRWADHHRNARHAARAWKFAEILMTPGRKGQITRRDSARLAAYFLAPTDAAPTQRTKTEDPESAAETIEASHKRVRRGLRDPWRYWAPAPGFQARQQAALKELLLQAERSPSPK